jgi:hypothetical protein
VNAENVTIVGVLFAFSTALLALVRDHFRRMERAAVRQAVATERLARRIGRYMGITLDPDEETSGVHELPEPEPSTEYHVRRRTRTPPGGSPHRGG